MLTLEYGRTDGETARPAEVDTVATVASSGWAVILRVAEDPGLVVKIYLDEFSRPGPYLRYREGKLTAMSAAPPPDAGPRCAVAWPVAVARRPGEPDCAAGYAMPFLDDCRPLRPVVRRGVAEDPPWHPQTGPALELAAAALDRLHGQDIVVGDVSPGNILVSEAGDRIALVDCDSWQWRDESAPGGGRAYYAEGFTAPYIDRRLRGWWQWRQPNCVDALCPRNGTIHESGVACRPRRPEHDRAALKLIGKAYAKAARRGRG